MKSINLKEIVFYIGLCIFFQFLLGCNQPPETTSILQPTETEFPDPECTISPPNRIPSNLESRALIWIDLSSSNRADELVVYHEGVEIYRCSSVLKDPLTGAGDMFPVIVRPGLVTLIFENATRNISETTEFEASGEIYVLANYSASRDSKLIWNISVQDESPVYE